MRIGIFGAGKLAQAIRAEAENSGGRVEVAWMLHRDQMPDAAAAVDVAIDASAAGGVAAHLDWALARRVPLVVGATGFDAPDLPAKVGRSGGAVLIAPNFSIGVCLVRRMAGMLGLFAAQDSSASIALFEHHHQAKADAPSGTAKSLAQAVMDFCPRYDGWTLGGHAEGKLGISALRAGFEVGYHEIILDTPYEQIKVTHRARDRRLFAMGALKAATWILGRTGFFSMDDVVGDLLGERTSESREESSRRRKSGRPGLAAARKANSRARAL
jgi:4-hydroxy-tetrahydrodipicolinate reductase